MYVEKKRGAGGRRNKTGARIRELENVQVERSRWKDGTRWGGIETRKGNLGRGQGRVQEWIERGGGEGKVKGGERR